MIVCANPNAQFLSYQTEIEDAVLRVLRSSSYILGNEVLALENEFANFIGTKFSIGVANGTDALELAIRSLQIGYGDEVITVSHTAVATVAAIEAAGATPVLVDVDPTFYTIDPDKLQEALTSKTKAIIAVHLYGQSADLDSIVQFCRINNLYLIEDVSQAHGAKFKGRLLGSIGTVGCFSCYPTKNLGGIGDAGLITTNDPDLNSKIRMLREYGWKSRYISEVVGRNSRLDELQAAILRVKLRYLIEDNAKRLEIARLYNDNLNKNKICLPLVRKDADSVFHLYVIRTEQRDKLYNFLKDNLVQAGIHYPVPIHMQPAYAGRVITSSNMSVTETLASQVLSLPIYPELPVNDCMYVIKLINNFFES